MKIIEIMEMNKVVPKVKAIEEVIRKTFEVIPKESYEILENLTHKSLEFYEFFNKRKTSKSLEKTERMKNKSFLNQTIENNRIQNVDSSLLFSQCNTTNGGIEFNKYRRTKGNFFTGSSKTSNKKYRIP